VKELEEKLKVVGPALRHPGYFDQNPCRIFVLQSSEEDSFGAGVIHPAQSPDDMKPLQMACPFV